MYLFFSGLDDREDASSRDRVGFGIVGGGGNAGKTELILVIFVHLTIKLYDKILPIGKPDILKIFLSIVNEK